MAERGGQEGNNNAGKNKPWADAIRRALLADDGKALRELAERLIARAKEGDVSALKEIGDRTDGKAAQSVTVSGDPDNPLHVVERRVVKAK